MSASHSPSHWGNLYSRIRLTVKFCKGKKYLEVRFSLMMFDVVCSVCNDAVS